MVSVQASLHWLDASTYPKAQENATRNDSLNFSNSQYAFAFAATKESPERRMYVSC